MRTYDAEDDNRDEDVTLDHLFKIWKQSAIAEVEEPEHELKDGFAFH